MYNLLIVDDEPLILSRFDALMPWEDYGIEAIYKAAGGVQALEILQSTQIDILITDIKMPGMDGLELIERIRKSNNPVSIIVLSGYNDFSLAKRALTWGIENYLLKPVEERELDGTLLSIVDKLDRKRAEDTRIREGTDLLRENIIFRLVSGSIEDTELIDRIAFLGMNFHGEYILAASVRFPNGPGDYAEMSRLASEVSDDVNLWCAPDPDGGLISLFCWSGDELDPCKCEQRLEERLALLTEGYVIRFGSIQRGWTQAHASWMDAAEPAVNKEVYPIVETVKDYVRSHIEDEMSLKTLAQKYHVNAAYLGQVFKKATGGIFSAYLARVRIERAKELLTETDCRISEIARMVGYTNNSYFSNQFKSLTGCYPMEYRRKGVEGTRETEKSDEFWNVRRKP